MESSTACILLSAGQSERLQFIPKAFLKFSNNENFIEHIIRIYSDADIHKIQVVINPKMENECAKSHQISGRYVVNNYPERGRLYSLQCGLRQLTDNRYCFVQNIDNPFVTPSLLENLVKNRSLADYITPVYNNKGGHPILITEKVIDYLLKLTNFNQTLRDVLQIFSRYNFPTDDPSVLININTQEDYNLYFGPNKSNG